MKSLIIEDDYITSQVLQEILLSFGSADTAEDGQTGVRKFKSAFESNNKFDIVFLDVMMPEMDGHEVLEELRSFESQLGINGLERTKIIMCTALDDYDNILKAFKNQCDAFLVKPISKNKISEIFTNLELI